MQDGTNEKREFTQMSQEQRGEYLKCWYFPFLTIQLIYQLIYQQALAQCRTLVSHILRACGVD